ncbi:MAG: ribonuclease III [Proteobacteria bacterium]|jgi:ribonuclease III|nr:ribonuclease III [Pseudomonadota bacterium]
MSEIQSPLRFKNKELFLQSMTHKSFHFENSGVSKGFNERLEFLGDAVLDLILSEYLMEVFPEENEGTLSKKRANLVNESTLAGLFQKLSLESFLKLGKGEQMAGLTAKPRLMASAYEALLGAYFLDQGFEEVRNVVREHFTELVHHVISMPDFDQDFKTQLQEWSQSKVKVAPVYKLINESGPAHDRTFEVAVLLKDVEAGRGMGKSKKQAEQASARMALLAISKTEKGEKT